MNLYQPFHQDSSATRPHEFCMGGPEVIILDRDRPPPPPGPARDRQVKVCLESQASRKDL